MERFHGRKKLEIIPSILSCIGINLVGIFVIYAIDSYVMLNLTKLVLLICDIFFLYNIGVWLTVQYFISKEEIRITALGGLKKVVIPMKDVLSYTTEEGKIKGIGLSGLFSNKFAVGRIAVKGLGTTRMFVTNSSKVIYIETKDLNYGISPVNPKAFEDKLKALNIPDDVWEKTYNTTPKLYKDLKFMLPIAVCTVSILWITFGPILLYILNMLPDVVPLSLDSLGVAAELGTDKQFAFSQMTYGLLNMAVFFCLYYAAQFCAKYDKKSAYNYIYAAALVALTFLYLQFVLITYRV